MAGSSHSKKRLTLGYLSFYQNLIMTGVLEAAKKYDVNIISFNCNSNVDVADFNSEMDALFELIKRQNLDGLLFLGWMNVIGVNMQKFREHFKSVPVYSLGSGYDDIPSASCDGSIFFREILEHLIQAHDCRRIALIEPIAIDSRVQVYTDLMKKIGTYDPELIIRSKEVADAGLNFEERARTAISILCDKRKIGFDAVASFFNLEAVAALQELKQRGKKIPEEIKVIGSEDKKPGRYSSPPLTTVYFPYREIGYNGCERFIELLESGRGNLPQRTVIPGRVVIRNSCGCISRTLQNTQEPFVADGENEGNAVEGEPGAICAGLRSNFPDVSINVERICTALIDDVELKKPAVFTGVLAEEIDAFFEDNDDAAVLENVISTLRWMTIFRYNGDAHTRLENLFHQARVVIQEKSVMAHGNNEIKTENLNTALQDIGKELLTTFDTERIFDLLEKKLPKMDVPSCYIFLSPGENGHDSLEDYRLVFHYSNNRRLSPDKSFTETLGGLPRTLFPKERRYTLSGHILFINRQTLGFAFFEHGPPDESLYASLAVQLSTALHGARLIRRILSAEEGLEQRARTIDELVRPMIAKIRHISSVVDEQSGRTRELEGSSRESNLRMKQTRIAVDSITQTLDRTKDLVTAINDISDTVDLVALNASIEAAHAGRFGTGFKVIATEIRKLAENTKRKAGETAEFLKSMNERIAEFVAVSTETAEVFKTLEKNIHTLVDSLTEVAGGMASLNEGNQAILNVMDRKNGGTARAVPQDSEKPHEVRE